MIAEIQQNVPLLPSFIDRTAVVGAFWSYMDRLVSGEPVDAVRVRLGRHPLHSLDEVCPEVRRNMDQSMHVFAIVGAPVLGIEFPRPHEARREPILASIES